MVLKAEFQFNLSQLKNIIYLWKAKKIYFSVKLEVFFEAGLVLDTLYGHISSTK